MPKKPKRAKPLILNDNRPQQDRSHYGKLHQRLRLQVLALRPICEYPGCTSFAHHAHHKIYPALTVADYMSICEKHHIQIHKGR